jgi:hypothetical protein
MKKIYKQIIAKQARCIDKALKRHNFKERRKIYFDRMQRGRDQEFREILGNNHLVFSRAYDQMLGSSDGDKAKALRSLFRTTHFNHWRNNENAMRNKTGRSSALWHYAGDYCLKFHVASQMFPVQRTEYARTSDIVKLMAKNFR